MAANKADGRGKSTGSRRTQFKPGEPPPEGSGRKKGTPNRNTVIRRVLDQVVHGEIGGKSRKIRLTEAVLMKLAQSALKGDLNSIKTVLALWKESEDAFAEEREAVYPFGDTDRQVIEDIYDRMKACEESGSGG